jgi:hypothetical protein
MAKISLYITVINIQHLELFYELSTKVNPIGNNNITKIAEGVTHSNAFSRFVVFFQYFLRIKH